MRIVDANVLLYAVNSDADHHDASRRWVDQALSGSDTVCFSWTVLLAFLRLATKTGLFPRPLTVSDAVDQVDAWLAAPGARLAHPQAGHQRVLGNVLAGVGTGGNLVNDAHLAALAKEQRATIVSYDNDFGRFPGVRWERPDDLLG